jgi:hypothetical protein
MVLNGFARQTLVRLMRAGLITTEREMKAGGQSMGRVRITEAGRRRWLLSARMAVPPRKPILSEEQRHALAVLASFSHGLTEELLVLAHGVDRAAIAGLVHEGLTTAEREVVTGPGRAVIEVVRIRITDRGGRRLRADRLPEGQ